MNLDTTIGDLLAQALTPTLTPAAAASTPLPVGKNVVVRTVTHTYVGRLADVADGWLRLDDAAWVADSRRWGQFLADGPTKEAEIEAHPDGPTWVSAGAVVDVQLWHHALLRVTQ